MEADKILNPLIEQGTLDYRTMPEGADRDYIKQYFTKYFGGFPEKPVDFVKIEGKYVYKNKRELRIPVQILNGVKALNLDNTKFVLPGTENRITQDPENNPNAAHFVSFRKSETIGNSSETNS